MSAEARYKARFDAADWLQECLTNNGHEPGAGWVLALVDGVAERLNVLSQTQVEELTGAVEAALIGERYLSPRDEARECAEIAVNTVFEFLGLRGEPPAQREC